MATRIYKLSGAGISTTNALASLRVVKPGTITGVMWDLNGLAGAGVDGSVSAELSKSNVNSINTNDTPGNVVSSANMATNVASSRASAVVYHGGLAVPVDTSETLYLNTVVLGTAFSNARESAYIAVLER